jgi:hypothetical protein
MIMSRKELDAQYNEHAQFNLTKLIRRNYEAGTPLPKEYFDGIDFLEESNKVLMLPVQATYGKQHRYDVQECLAANIVGLLPLEYYKQYIQPTWIMSNKSNDYGTVRKALDEQNYDFLYEILSQSKEYLKDHSDTSNREDNKFIGAYENSLLSQILDLDSNINQLNNLKLNQEAYDNYFKLFKTALSDFKEYYNTKYEMLFNSEIAKNLEFDENLWFQDYKKMKGIFRQYPNEKTVLETLAKDPKAFEFFKDIFNQYGKSEDNPFDKDIFEKAFYHGNKKVVTYIVQNKPLNSQEVNQAFESVLEYWVDNQESKVTDRHNNQLVDCSVYLKNLLDRVQKNAPGHKIENYELFSSILAAINKDLFDDVMVKYPELKEEKLRDGLTLNQWHYAKELFNGFIKEHNFKLVESEYGSNYPSYDLFYMDKVTEHYKSTKEITLDEKMAIDEIIAIHFLPLLNTDLDNREKSTLFYKYTLNKQMHDNKSDGKRLKI